MKKKVVAFVVCSMLAVLIFSFVACGAQINGTYKMFEVRHLLHNSNPVDISYPIEDGKREFGDRIANIGEKIVIEHNKAYFYGKANKGVTATFRTDFIENEKVYAFTFVKNGDKLGFDDCVWRDGKLEVAYYADGDHLIFVYAPL